MKEGLNKIFVRVSNSKKDRRTFSFELMKNLPTAGIFIDFFEPAYNSVIQPDYKFKLDSIYKVQKGTSSVIIIKTQDNSTKISLPFDYNQHFTIPQVLSKASKLVSLKPISKLLNPGFTLKPGSYKLFIVTQSNNSTLKSREHKFEISEFLPPKTQTRKYCAHAWKDLLLREYGSMPCCYLNRNEKLLYNAYSTDKYDPWNNDAWKALRQSLVDGNPKYCHSKCMYMTDKPVTKEEFLLAGEAVDKNFFKHNKTNEARYLSYLNGDIELNEGPARIGIMVGTVCNIDCIFCPIPFLDNRRTIFSNNMMALLKKHVAGAQRITFTGGEPLVYIKKLKELECYFHKDLTIQIVTNGIAANKLIDFALNSKLCLRISLNCANAEDYLYLHEKDFFDRIISNVRHLKKIRPDVYISMKFMIMKRTVQDIEKFAKLCCDLQVNECAYTTLWIKTQSKISANEKILATDQEFNEANTNLLKAEKILQTHKVDFRWTEWDTKADDL